MRLYQLSEETRLTTLKLVESEAKAQSQEAFGLEMEKNFKLLSMENLARAQEDLLKKADEQARTRQEMAHLELEKQLKPMADTLAKFEAQVAGIEKSRAEDQGGLKAQIRALLEATAKTEEEARKLSQALRRGTAVQGRWGEQTLRNVLEAAGLDARFDFIEQATLPGSEGLLRPDVKVKLPGRGVFVIDAKCSFAAFVEAQETNDEAQKKEALKRHAASVRQHMQSLSAKTYWDQFREETSPDFVAMFVPGDGFLAAALECNPELMTEAMNKRVILVTPSTLFALCKAVAYGWRVEEQSQNAQKIAEVGRELYRRLVTMGGHISGLGEGLRRAVSKYNDFIGSLETQVLTQAKRFETLSADHEAKPLPRLDPLDESLRSLTKLHQE